MKKIWLLIVMILCCGVLTTAAHMLAGQRTARLQGEIAGEVIRFHVRANSESEADQQMKMRVKEAVISYLEPVLKDADSISDAKRSVLKQLNEMEAISEKVLEDAGYAYGAKVEFQKESFPKKVYGDYVLPAGVYSAVVISLGKGTGHNWWCMLYPRLCFVNESYAVVETREDAVLKEALTEDAYELITQADKRKIGFFLPWLDDAARKIVDFIRADTGNP